MGKSVSYLLSCQLKDFNSSAFYQKYHIFYVIEKIYLTIFNKMKDLSK